jgi:cell division protein FtsI/penicillin-binding protein 2
MDFFLVIALFIFIFTFLFYVQYVQKENKYNSTNKELQTNIVERDALKAQLDAKNSNNTSEFEKNYNVAYDELSAAIDSIKDYTRYIEDIYNSVLPGVTINEIEVRCDQQKFVLMLTFDRSQEGQSQVNYEYRNALLDLDWVPTNGVVYSDTSLNTRWEVLVDGSTTKE